MRKMELGIYVHIPFCAKKCYYCDFISFPNKQETINDYIESLKKEIEYVGVGLVSTQKTIDKHNANIVGVTRDVARNKGKSVIYKYQLQQYI